MRDQTDSKSDEWLCGCCGLRFKSRVLLKRHAKSHRDKTEIPDPGPDGRTFKNHYNTFSGLFIFAFSSFLFGFY